MSGHVQIHDEVWRKLRHKLERGESGVKVGIVGSHGAGETHGEGGITIVELAMIHEYGSPAAGIPERRPIRRTFEQRHDELARVQAHLAKLLIFTNLTKKAALDKLGLWGAAAVKRTITEGEGVPPPNAPATIERKGSSRPLVDTGRLVNSYAHEVVPEGSGEGGGHGGH